MKYHKFRIDVFYPPEYRKKFHDILSSEERKEDVSCQYVIEETAPPPEMLKDAILVLASTLTILKILYDFHKEIKGKGGRVYLTAKGQQFDLEAYNLDEIKVKIGEPSVKRYKVELTFPNLPQDEVKRVAPTLSFRPIYLNGKELSRDNEVQFADYDDVTGKIKTTIHVSNEEVNDLYERGVPVYATAEYKKAYEVFLCLILSTEPIASASRIEEY